jgi:hypothetical protein
MNGKHRALVPDVQAYLRGLVSIGDVIDPRFIAEWG